MTGALWLLGFVWSILGLIVSMVASLGLLAWPWSSDPAWCALVGLAGGVGSILCAWVLTRFYN